MLWAVAACHDGCQGTLVALGGTPGAESAGLAAKSSWPVATECRLLLLLILLVAFEMVLITADGQLRPTASAAALPLYCGVGANAVWECSGVLPVWPCLVLREGPCEGAWGSQQEC